MSSAAARRTKHGLLTGRDSFALRLQGLALCIAVSTSMKPLFFPIAALACAFAACTPNVKSEEEAVFSAIRENLQAMEREDIDAVMATVHPATPDFEASKGVIQDIFKKYDLKFELTALKLVSLT